MSLSFQTNVTALTAENNLQVNSQFQSNTITQLTSATVSTTQATMPVASPSQTDSAVQSLN